MLGRVLFTKHGRTFKKYVRRWLGTVKLKALFSHGTDGSKVELLFLVLRVSSINPVLTQEKITADETTIHDNMYKYLMKLRQRICAR
jgi:hypothetical protein